MTSVGPAFGLGSLQSDAAQSTRTRRVSAVLALALASHPQTDWEGERTHKRMD